MLIACSIALLNIYRQPKKYQPSLALLFFFSFDSPIYSIGTYCDWCYVRLQVVGKISNLTLIVSASTVGRYHCKATTPGFGEVNAEATVSMKGAPVIDSPRVQYGTLSETVRVECTASSVPVADRIVWTYHGTVIGTKKDQNYYSVSGYIVLCPG